MHSELIYDWNDQKFDHAQFNVVELCDETLRDGIQSPSVHDPDPEQKWRLVELMDKLGITIANIGLPGAGPRAVLDVTTIAKHVRDRRLKLQVNCAARTHLNDIEPIVRIQQDVGIPITAYCFLGTSPIRQMVENWELDKLKSVTDQAISFAVKEGLKVAFVTEDTIRSDPETLGILFNHAIYLGAERLVLCDTVGHATPYGVRALIEFTQKIIADSRTETKIDWHGHNDRGLAVVNALVAAECGAHRIHGTALGIGERVGNTAIDQLIVNLKLLNAYPHDVSSLLTYLEEASRACKVDIPSNYPMAGQDAFRTATGVHAAAVIKAQKTGDLVLADTIYSGVPAHWFGKKQSIEIGPMSGASNVRHWLTEKNLSEDENLVKSLLEYAKTHSRVLYDQEIFEFLKEFLKKT